MRLTEDQRGMVERYLWVARTHVAKTLTRLGRRADVDAIESAANMGLTLAAATFDPDKGVAFATWATIRVRWAITDYINEVSGKRGKPHIGGNVSLAVLDFCQHPPVKDDHVQAVERSDTARAALNAMLPKERKAVALRCSGVRGRALAKLMRVSKQQVMNYWRAGIARAKIALEVAT
jgi:RNA polymerase sigma factor (sigma-70 family)